MLSSLVIAAILPLAQLTNAWGTLGHETIAWIAQSYVSSATKTAVQSILGSTQADYMANVSTWADSYRYTSGGGWSAPLHYIDANDNPPESCSVDFNRDCGEAGCSVSAIMNYTSILLDDQTKSSTKLDAMRFVIHFVGDLHQPLHDEAIDVGGNTINVTYDGEHTNLHHIWDTEIVEQLADGQDAEAFGKNLTAAIKAGDYGWDASTWLDGISLNDTHTTAMSWASEANGYVCTDVLAPGVDAVEQGDLSSTYYKAHYDVARIQLARAGYRLGAWLDLIYTGQTSG
ncbi:Nuclease S1 [Fonsecaea pedrosoi]|nr:Nuclease S1 [Fonsecaea pedrosoi]